MASCRGDATGPTPSVDVASVSINQPSFAIERGFHQTLTATVRNKAGEAVAVPVIWRSSKETVATLDASGRVTAIDTGITTVVASTIGLTSQPIGIRVVWQGAAKVVAYQYTAPNAATPGVTVPDSIRVQVVDAAGNPVPTARVRFASTAGGGAISPTTIVSVNRAGIAAVRWTLGPSFGANTITASVLDDDDRPLAFVAGNALPFTVTTYEALRAVSGDGQTGQILAALAVAPSIRLVDSAGKPRAGVSVTFTPTVGGRVASTTVSTGADGIASPGDWILGDIPGTQDLLVKVESAMLSLRATGTGTPIHFIPAQLAAAGYATCAILTDGTVNCWGEQPKIGNGGTKNEWRPTPTSGSVGFSTVAGSPTHYCGVASDRAIYCWGTNALADTSGVNVHARVPTRVASDIPWNSVAPGFQHNCALASDQTAYCWGDNTYGQLGDRTLTLRYVPGPVYGNFKFTSITSGSLHSCGITADGAAFCWGVNSNGQLGDGTTTSRSSPTAVGGGLTFQSVGAGEAITCGLTTVGKPYCWGLLSPTVQNQSTPLAYPSAPTFISLSVGGGHACGLTADGSAYCWGNNVGGQLGDSTTTNRADPTAVVGGLKFRSISAGYLHTCGRTLDDGSVACWGLNRFGELGDSTSALRVKPRYVVLGVNP